MTDRRRWTIAIFWYVALVGAILQMRGALLPSFEDAFRVTESQLGLIATAASIGFLLSVFAVGLSVSRLDARRTLLPAFVVLAGLLFAIGASPTYLLLMGAFLASGLARGVLHALDRPLLSHLYPERRGRMYNLQDMAWAVGATAGPLLAGAAVAYLEWRVAYYLLALAFLPVIALVWRLESPTLTDERTVDVAAMGEILGTPAVAAMGALILLLSLVESGVFTWLPYYLDQSLPQGVASASLSVYLAAYIPGRYAFALATERADKLLLVTASAVLATGALVAFLTVDGYAAVAVVFVVGFLVAGMFPTLLAWATDAAPEFSGPVNALALGVSGVGFMIFPPVMGVVAERANVWTAMALLAVAMGLLALLAGAIAAVRNRWG